jgi:hypothetical protein
MSTALWILNNASGHPDPKAVVFFLVFIALVVVAGAFTGWPGGGKGA